MTARTVSGVQRDVQKFLDVLNGAGGPPMEQLTPDQARAVLVEAQRSVPVDLSRADVTNRTITHDGQTVTLVRRPTASSPRDTF